MTCHDNADPPSKWAKSIDFPSRVFSDMSGFFGGDEYELYEGGVEFVPIIDYSMYEPKEIGFA